jgi:cytosine/creatinine deaminase
LDFGVIFVGATPGGRPSWRKRRRRKLTNIGRPPFGFSQGKLVAPTRREKLALVWNYFMDELILKNVRVWGNGDAVDVRVVNGFIQTIGKNLGDGEDFAGRVLLPGFVESHCHLDKTMSLGTDGLENTSGTLLEAIERWYPSKLARTKENFKHRATFALNQTISKGTTFLRSHIDMDSPKGLEVLEVMQELKETFRDRIFLELVALGMPGTSEGDALMTEALQNGIDVVGGCPHITPDPIACMKSALDLAEKFDKPVDLHMDEDENPDVLDLDELAEMVKARGLQGKVTADHCCSLSVQPKHIQEKVIEQVAEAGINIISLPSVNLMLQGHNEPMTRGLAPIKKLLDKNIPVAVGSDNVRDPFQPMGNYDLLWQANLAIHAAHLASPTQRRTALDLITTQPAKILGLPNYGLEVGCQADMVILDAYDLESTLAMMSPRLRVYKAGKLVYKQEISENWF